MRGSFDDHAQSRVGTVVQKKYRLERLVGSGGMASVYEAVHRNGHRAAIKMLHPHLCLNTDLRARFLREGYVANKVDHRGAVRVLDDDVAEDGAVFLVMELLEGQTLDERWEEGGHRLPHRVVCELAYQLLDVLAVAHARGIVHRDIKPDNLFLTRDGSLKVLDFGIARLQEAGAAEGLTRTGGMLGTPAFMPPEQALGRSRQIDGQTDLWAAGATMFTLASGRYVHEAETVEEMLVHAGSRQARSVTSVAPDLAPDVAAVVDRALAFAKEQRWPDARSMALALEAAYAASYRAPIQGERRSSNRSVDPIAFAETKRGSGIGASESDPSLRDGARAKSSGPAAAVPPPAAASPPAASPPATVSPPATSPLGAVSHTVDAGTAAGAPWAVPPDAPQGTSTTAGFTHTSRAAAAGMPTRAPAARTRWIGWSAALTGLIVLAGGGAVALRTRGPGAAATAPPAAHREPPASAASARFSAAAPPAVPVPGASADGLRGRPAPTVPSTTAVADAPPDSTPAAASTFGPAPVPVARPVPPPPSAAPPRRVASPVVPTDNCDPPYTIDSAGHRQYKRKCLTSN